MSGMHSTKGTVSTDGTDSTDGARVAGVLLAAGSGSRYGSPKALVVDNAGESWLVRSALALEAGGCDPVLVVLGAAGLEAEALLRAATGRFERPDRLQVLHAECWAEGLSASVDAGLASMQTGDPLVTAVALVPVDVPDLDGAIVARLIGDGEAAGSVTVDTLRQAYFGGLPGHPVVIGRAHWAALRAELGGDTGARPYLVAHGVTAMACDDLGMGLDVDRPPMQSPTRYPLR